MLSDKLRNSYTASQSIELRTKTSSFRRLNRVPINSKDSLFDKISCYIAKTPIEQNKVSPESTIDEYSIVENPNEVRFEFPDLSNIAPDHVLPFFKSITYKLAKVYA